MYYAYGRLPMAFVVLACIGCCMIAFSVVRILPLWIIGVLSIAVMLGAPLYAQDQIVYASPSGYLINALFNLAIPGSGAGPSFMVIYPVLPWIGCFGVGWVLGIAYERGCVRGGRWLIVGGVVLVIGSVLLRWFGGNYADRFPVGDGPLSSVFWAMSKYPPSPFFSP